jgi:parvulin-like peptidyl-prolyl isomerase
VFGLAQCDREPERSTDVLAGVGNYDITTTEFTNTFNEAYFKTGQALVPDARTRRALLMNDLSGYILANRAKEQGLHQTEEGQRKLKRVRRRVINEEVRERFIVADVEVLEEDLNEAFLRFNTKIKASHLIASSKDEAVALKKRLAQGESFESLASEVFKNPTLASNGGDLGYFSIDEMDVGFEDVAYRLSVGEVSSPVRTAQGYSIIKVTDRVQTPILTQQQFARAKPQIYSYVKGKKEELLERAHLQSFLDSSEVAVNNVNELFEMQESQVNIGDLNWEDSTYLLRYKDFQFSMSDFANEYGLNPERESIFLSTKSAFNKLIKALAYRNYLYEMGLRNGLDNEPEITASIEETFAMELESLALKQIDESFTPSEDAIIDEYQRNRKQYIEPLKVKLRRLKVEDKNLANMLHKELENGASMVDLIAKHSSDPQDRLLKGVLGYKSINSFGTQAQQIARLEVGDISSVLEYSSNEYHIYECLGREESRQLSFVEAYSQVEERLRQKHRQRKQASLVEEALQSQHAFINEALLDTFEIEIYN